MFGGGLEVGRVFAAVGAKFEDEGFARWERRYRTAKEQSARPVDAKLEATAHTGGFDTYDRRLRQSAEHTREFGHHIGGLALALVGGGGVIGLEEAVRKSTERLGSQQVVGRQTEAVLKSTGGQAHVTAMQVDELAASLGRKAGMDHEAIAQGENMLLTFRDIRNEAGKNNDIFNQGTKAAVDMSAAFTAAGKSMNISDATLQLGKALNDPIKGMTRLQRIGVTFTQGQKDQVAAMEAAGNRIGAQKVILEELNKEFGGSAEAAGKTMPAAITRMKTSLEDLGAKLLSHVQVPLTHAFDRAAKFTQQMIDGTGAGGRFADKAKEIGTDVWNVVSAFAQATGGVISFFAHHKDLLTVAATMAGIAGSVRAIRKLGDITGLSKVVSLLTGLRGGAGGGLVGGIATRADPLPVYVVNQVPGGGGGGNPLVRTVERGAEDVGGGAAGADAVVGSASGGAMAAGGGLAALGIIGLGKLAATQYHSATAADIRHFNQDLGILPTVYDPSSGRMVPVVGNGFGGTSASGVSRRPGALDRIGAAANSANGNPLAGDPAAITATGDAWGKVGDRVVGARKAVAEWMAALRNISRAPIDTIRDAAQEAVKAMGGAKLSTQDLDRVIRDADKGAFGPASSTIHDTAQNVENLRDRLSHLDKGSGDYKQTASELQRAQNRLNAELVAAYRAGRRGAQGIGSIATGAFSASSAVEGAASTIATDVDRLAKQLGAQGVHFTPAPTAAGRQNQDAAFGSLGATTSDLLGGTFAGGGHLYVGGSRHARGPDDRVIVGPHGPEAKVAPGELVIANGDQQNALDRILHHVGAGGWQGFFSGRWRDHQHTAPPAYAGGGHIPDIGIRGPAGGYQRAAQGASSLLDRAAEHKIAKLLAEPVNRMIRFGRQASSRFPKYVYGGGHGSFDGPYDCSGLVSADLHAGGFLSSPMSTDGLKTFGEPGDGRLITIGVRGSTGRNAHTMILVGKTGFESGGSGGMGAHERGSWDGTFPIHRHPKGFAKGGRVPPIDKSHLPAGLRRHLDEHPELLDPAHPDFVGFGLAHGGVLPAFAGGGIFAKAEGLGASGRKLGSRAARFTVGYEQKISDLERTYGQRDRLYGLSDEQLIAEGPDGPYIDQKAVKKHAAEIGNLVKIRKKILSTIEAYIRACEKAEKTYNQAIGRLRKAIKAVPKVKGKSKEAKRSRAEAAKLRSGYSTLIGDYEGRLSDVKGIHHGLPFDATDSRIDLKELAQEANALSPGALAADLAADPNAPGGGDGSSGDASTGDGSGASAAPSASDVAAAAIAQFQTFQTARADLFKGFGDNSVAAPDLAKAVADGIGQAAGLRYFGAAGAQDGTGGGTTVNQTVNIAGTATDEMSFAQRSAHELRAAIG